MKVHKESWGFEVAGTFSEVLAWMRENEGKLPPGGETIVSVVTVDTKGETEVVKREVR